MATFQPLWGNWKSSQWSPCPVGSHKGQHLSHSQVQDSKQSSSETLPYKTAFALINSAWVIRVRSMGAKQSSVVKLGELSVVPKGSWPRSHWEMNLWLPKAFIDPIMATKMGRKWILWKVTHFSLFPKHKCSSFGHSQTYQTCEASPNNKVQTDNCPPGSDSQDPHR